MTATPIGVVSISSPITARGVRTGRRDADRDLQDLAVEEARHHEQWSDGLTPDEYLLALVDRAQARKNPSKETRRG